MGVRVHLGGELLVEGETGLLRAGDLPGRQGRLALARLALTPHPVAREELADLIWAGQLPRSWERDLSTVLSKVRAALASVGVEDGLANAMGCYQLRLGSDAHVDVLDALRNVEEAEIALRRDEDAKAQAAAEVAVNLARRPFLPGEEGEWVDGRRAEQRRLLVRSLDALVVALLRRSSLPDALRYAAEAVELEPFRETGYAALMRVQVAAGDRADALRTYERARTLLAEELGIPPSQVLETAYREALHADAEPVEPAQGPPAASRAMPEGTVTLLFTDLVGSTELAERLGAEQSEELRRAHFGILRDAAATRRGHEVKNLGDGLMLAFASAGDAVGCAVDIQQSVARHNQRSPAPLAVRVGVHVGEPVLEGGDYFGLPVAIASRLCAAAEGGEVLVSDVVRVLAGADGASFAESGDRSLKGVAEPVTSWAVAWTAREDHVLALPPPARASDSGFPLVGRADAIERFAQLIESARKGSAEIVLVAGEPGIGKTRLLSEIAAHAHASDATVLWGRCEQDASAPYRPFTEAIGHAVAVASDGDLRRWVGARASELARVVPLLGERLGGVAAALDIDAEADRARLFDAMAVLLRSVAADRPLVLVIDDAHWIDSASALLLRHLMGAALPGVVLVASYRQTDLDRLHALADLVADLRRDDRAVRIAPRPLDARDIEVLLGGEADTMHPERLALANALFEQTEGNPFFVREVIRHLEETGRIDRRSDQWRFDGGVRELGIPEGVRELVGRRLSRFKDELNAALRAGAVIGREFELAVLGEVIGRDPEELLDGMTPALAAGLVVEVSGAIDRFAFSHALVQETLAAELPASKRVRLHRKVAETIESVHAKRLDRHVDELAHHYAEAAPTGTSAKAVEYLRLAAGVALRQVAYETADAHLQRALELADEAELGDRDRCELLLEHGAVLRALGDPRQNSTVLAAAALARELDDDELFGRAALTIVEPWVLVGLGTPLPDPEVVGLLDDAIARQGYTPMGIRLRSYRIASLAMNQAPESSQEAKELLAIVEASGDPEVIAAAWDLRDIYEWSLTDVEAMKATLAEWRAAGRQLGDPMPGLAADLSGVCLAMINGDVVEADSAAARFAELVERLHLGVYRWIPSVWSAARDVLAGRFDAAERALAAATAGLSGKVASYTMAQVSITYFELLRQRGQLAPIVDAIGRNANRYDTPAYWTAHVLALIETGRETDARIAYAAAKERRIRPTALYFLPAEFHFRTLAAHRLDDAELGEELYAMGSEFADLIVVGGALAACYGSAQYGLGLAATLCERWDDAEEHFSLARERNAALGSPPWVAHTERDHADMLLRRGRARDRTRARELASSALATAETLGMARLAYEVRETLATL